MNIGIGWWMYLANIVDNLRALFIVISFVSLVFLFFVSIGYFAEKSEGRMEESRRKWFVKWMRRLSFILIFFCFTSALIPTRNVVLGLLVVNSVSNNETVKTETKEIYDAVKSILLDEAKKQP